MQNIKHQHAEGSMEVSGLSPDECFGVVRLEP